MEKVKLANLDCGNCAIKIEKALKQMDIVNNVKLNFVTSTLSFEKSSSDKNLYDEIEKVIQSYEKDVYIIKEKETNKNFWELLDKKLLLKTIFSILITYISYNFFENSFLQIFLFLIAYLLVGLGVVSRAFSNIVKGKVFDEHFLMTIATFGAFALGEYVEAIAVMLFYQIGEMFQGVAVKNSRDNINSLIDIKPEFANILENGNIIKKDPSEVKIGDTLLVKNGEKVAVDGILLDDNSFFDTSAITGEFKPKSLNKDEAVFSGYINLNKASYIKATSTYNNSTIAKIIEMIESASEKKANAEKFITKFAAIYTPIVVALAFLLATLPPLLFSDAIFSDWFERALIFLVISCPCALVVSVPLSFFSAIGAVSKKGVLVKGSNYIEKLSEIKSFVFDKTGTLTHGVFELKDVVILDNTFTKDELLRYAAFVESFSEHPIAKSIVNSYNKEIDPTLIKNHEEINGLGVKAEIENKNIYVGNARFLSKEKILVEQEKIKDKNPIFLVINKKVLAYFIIDDKIKDEAKTFVQELKRLNIKDLYMLTGDKKEVALDVSQNIGIENTYYELLPKNKLEIYNTIKNKNNNSTAFVGDGINDAPTLANADLGISMGGIGSDLAIKSSDIIILNDKLTSINEAIKISLKTKKIVYQNIIFIMATKVAFLLLGAGAAIGMAEAIFADVGVALIAIFNSMRILKEDEPQKCCNDEKCTMK